MNRKALLTLTILCALLLPGHDSAPVHAQGPVFYVTPAGGGGCTSWADACTLQDAIQWAGYGDEIWVAEGTHLSGCDPDRSVTFQLVNGVAWYGGFPAGGGTWDQRDWIGNETILSGENCYHIVTASGVDTSTVLDGFTIMDGNANEAPDVRGGGMLNTAGSPTIRNVIFRDNYAAEYGGGMHNEEGSTPTLENVTFRYNTSYWGGGLSAVQHSDLTLTDVVFELNLATEGGGLAADMSAPTLTRVRFVDNSATGEGGGLASVYSAHPVVTDSTFEGNSAQKGGAIYNVAAVTLNDSTVTGNDAAQTGGGVCNAIYVVAGSMWISGSSITGNSADQQGGGVYNSGFMAIEDSTISGNEADPDGGGGDGYGGGVYNVGIYGLDVDNSVVEGNSAIAGGGIYNQDGVAIFTNVTVSGNSADQDGGGIYDHSSSSGAKLFNVTITGNVADADDNDVGNGGGMAWNLGTVHLENTIVAGNDDSHGTTHHPDCSATGGAGIQGGNYNLIGDGTGCDGDFVGTGNQVGSAASPLDPRLGRLANNGGPTQTHALLWDSPARDAGDPAGCYQSQPPYSVGVDQRHMPRPRDGNSDGTAFCDIGAFEAGPPNDAWYRAEELDLSGGSATRYEYVDQLGQSRWYKFQVAPGSRITAEMFPPDANLDIALFGDIQAAYDELQAPTGQTDLVQLNAEFAADAFSPFAYSPFAYSPFAYSPFAYSPFAYSPFAYSPFAYSPFAYSPFAYSPFAYSPFAYSPFAYSPAEYNPFAYSPDKAYTSAQVQTLMAISAFDGTATELIEVNTWDNHGWFYLRASGRNGAFDLRDPFTLQVTQDEGVCLGVDLIERDSPLAASNGGYHTLILTDWDRFVGADPDELSALQVALDGFVAQYGGLVLDVGDDDYVQQANDVADAAPQCPYAKNQVAWLIKDIVTAYRDAENPLEYVVLVGGDSVIPFFRYPDRAEIGSEKDYKPPVLEGTSSYASLTLGYVLSQDAYGSNFDLALSNTTLPIPDLAVGRLVETPADIMNMLDTYTLHGGAITPETALVAGYDFLADAADAIAAELEAGFGQAEDVDTLISPQEVSPADRDGTPPEEAAWPSSMLDDLLLGQRHDLVFLAGHFTAQGALAADYETRLWASELLDPGVDLENALVYSAGCHSGYNVVDEHGVPYVTIEPDWAQAFAQAGATYIGGTGYQYGDTDFLEYSERLYLEFTRELRCGDQPRSVGQALVEAKQAYLAGTAEMRGIHEKALLEATLFGLPMFEVDGLSGAGCPADPTSEVAVTHPYGSNPGAFLDLQYADVTVTSNLTLQTVPLRNVVQNPEPAYIDATYFSGTNGVVTSPAEPVLPLEQRNVHVDGYVLRGAGFRGGRYADLPSYIPLTGAATTETRAAHTPFQSDVLYPLQPWSVNYFDLLTEPPGGITWLNVTPAQFVSDDDGDIWTGTWRRFEDMEFRLYYSNHTAVLDAGAVPSLAAPPAILQVLATSATDEVQFQVAVAGDLAAGIQEVWVTYTGIPCNGGACWQSLDLAQNADDSTLWEGTLQLDGAPSGDIRYVVQAVNGVGLVSLVTNQGEYFQIDVDPADPSEPPGGGKPASQPEGTSVELLSPPSSGAYSTEVDFSAVLRTAGGIPVEGQRLTFSLGAQQRSAVTNGNGIAEVSFPLHGSPGEYTVSATFGGTVGYQRSLAASPFTLLKQDATLTFLADPGVAQYSENALMTAQLTDADGRALGETSVLFLVSGGGEFYAVAGFTDLIGQSGPGSMPLPMGIYAIESHFGQEVSVNGEVVDLTDPNYHGASTYGTLEVWPEDASVSYPPFAEVAEGSTTLNLEAMVTQADDGSPGDLSKAWVLFEVWDLAGNWIAEHQAQAESDGTVVAVLEDLLPGPYQVDIDVTVFGGYFSSDPAPQIAGLSLPPEPVAVDSEITASAFYIDADSPYGHWAVWEWGDGTPATTCTSDPESLCELTDPSGLIPGQTTAAHTYTEPGVYTVRLTVADGDEYTAEAIYEFVVVYSLEGGSGFVTGGGWIWSQAGWCQLDEACAEATGKANFGFVSRYKKGANTPTGTSEFNFSAGRLNFHSDSYEWLVVNQAGTNAQFKGSGTVNGEGSQAGNPYKFMIWAGDGDPDDDDTFRIKIWYEDGESEVVVYDNGLDQALGDGSIVIHQKD